MRKYFVIQHKPDSDIYLIRFYWSVDEKSISTTITIGLDEYDRLLDIENNFVKEININGKD